MPVIKSSIKRVRTNNKANVRNSAKLSQARTAIKKFKDAKENNADNIQEQLNNAMSAIDTAKSNGIIKANKAKREKSHLSKMI